jgi:Tol biopolymer transport system component
VLFDTETDREEQLTSPIPTTPIDEVAYGWSPDGRYVISSTDRHTPGVVSIVKVPVDARPTAEKASVRVTENRKYMPWNTRMSPNTRWICFNATDATRLGGASRLAVVPSGGGDWIWMTGTDSWIDKPRWSADGRLIYYISRQGGFFNVWATGFDPVAGAAVGRPFQVTHFDGPGQQIPPSLGEVELGVGGGRLAIPIITPKGGILMLETVSR